MDEIPDEVIEDEVGENIEEEDVVEGSFSEEFTKKGRTLVSGRSITLLMLVNDKILEPGKGCLTIDYLGVRFLGDLLPDGKIRWQQTGELFPTPSAWALHCKKLLNPDKKSGCGWAFIKYKGKKLDSFKLQWFRKYKSKREEEAKLLAAHELEGGDCKPTSKGFEQFYPLKSGEIKGSYVREKTGDGRLIVSHNVLGNRSPSHNTSTLVLCTPFSAMDRLQPFTVTIASNCMLLIDFHCHLSKNEVTGYLGGTWDVTSHNLAILQAYPCKCDITDKENASKIEDEIKTSMQQRHVQVIGWYHSHPTCPAQPSIKDVDNQMEYQITMKGETDSSYIPCLGFICSPYNKENPSFEADYQGYWVMPPPEYRPHEYGKPMQMSFTPAVDSFLTQELLMEMRMLADYYRSKEEMIKFDDVYLASGITYWKKMKASLTAKLPRDLQTTDGQTPEQEQAQLQALSHFWDFIKGLITEQSS